MTIKECYAKMGGDYEDVLRRLMNDALIKRFLVKFLDDQSFAGLTAAFDAGDADAAFREAHTLKGVSMNLGLGALGASASGLTELLRGGAATSEVLEFYGKVRADYENVVTCIRELLQDAVR